MNKGIFVLSIALLWSFQVKASGIGKDSIGLERKGNIAYILHKVDPKETLFSLSKRYNAQIDDILRHNPSAKEGLKISEVLRIPFNQNASGQAGVIHTVQTAETLFSISQRYGVSTSAIARVNDLNDNNIKVGQKLVIPAASENRVSTSQNSNSVRAQTHIVEGGETLFRIAKMYNVSVSDLRDWNHLEGNNLEIGQEIIIGRDADGSISDSTPSESAVVVDTHSAPDPKPEINEVKVNDKNSKKTKDPILTADRGDVVNRIIIEDNQYQKENLNFKSQQSKKYQKVLENGLAEVIEGTDETRKYLALHKEAPVGTIMQVKNEMNNLSVFVRVIGTLPDTGDNAKLKVKLSKTAYDRLGAIDPRFPVEISYVR